MLLPDVNVIVYAFRQDSPRHGEHRAWLDEAVHGPEPVGVSELVLSGFIRIVTHHRIFREPSTPEAAIGMCASLLSAPASVAVRPGSRHWSLFAHLVRTLRLRGNQVPDGYLAALALENDATLVTEDRGFARFPDLRARSPLVT